MALNFPNSPSLNQTYTLGNKRWKYNGNAWILDTTVFAPNVVFLGSITSESFVGDGAEANVVLSNTFGNEAELLVFVDGVIQEPDTNYVVSGNTITFSSAPLEGSNVFVRYLATTNSAIITTANVAEGDNLYFTNTRAIGAFTAGTNMIIDANGLITANVTGGGASVTVSNTSPESANEGDLYWDEDYGRLFVYYDDGDTQQWVDASPATYLPNSTIVGAFTEGDGIIIDANGLITANVTSGTSTLQTKQLIYGMSVLFGSGA